MPNPLISQPFGVTQVRREEKEKAKKNEKETKKKDINKTFYVTQLPDVNQTEGSTESQ